MIAKILQKRFGRNSDFAKRNLGTFDDSQRIRNYFSAVLLAVARKWFGSDDFLLCDKIAISQIFEGKSFNEKESVFQEIPEPQEIADHFGPFYVHLIPPQMRRTLGEFYTPDWLAEKLLDTALLCGDEKTVKSKQKEQSLFPVLDPACGSGVFLLAVFKRFRKRFLRFGCEPEQILSSLTGFDKNPTAVLACRLNLATALFFGRKFDKRTKIPQIPVYVGDSLLGNFLNHQYPLFQEDPEYSLILGNPPWINWDRISVQEREELRELWKKYGLFNLSGKEARYGGAKKEFASLFLLRNADRFLATGGRIAMVVPRSLFQTIHSGTGFRQFEIPSQNAVQNILKGVPLKVLRVDDFSAINVFSGVATKTATIILEKGIATNYPIPYHIWKNRTQSIEATAIPSNPTDRLSAWKIETKNSKSYDSAKPDVVDRKPDIVERNPDIVETKNVEPINAQKHRAYLGANTGGANGVFWLEILKAEDENLIRVRNHPEFGKRKVAQVEFVIESALVYPLLRWKDVDRFKIQTPSLGILLPQDVQRRIGIAEEQMRSLYPKTLAYLSLFETELRERAAFRKYFPSTNSSDPKTKNSGAPFYSMYNIGPQTLAPIKVVWRRMDSKLRAALVEPLKHPILGERPIVPQETTVILPCESREQGLRFVAILNSPETEAKIASLSAVGTKGFGSPGLLQYLDLGE